MHELASLKMTTTDQFYIFMWIAVTVIALRPATQLIKNDPFPRWWGYGSLWSTTMFEAGAFAFIPRTGPFAWNGLLVFWSPLTCFLPGSQCKAGWCSARCVARSKIPIRN